MDRMTAGNREGRIVYIDALKGVAIFLVVLGHVVTNREDFRRLYNFIYSFHMPLFMFLAGCTTVISYRRKATGYLKKRFVNIMVPYFAWALFLPIAFTRPLSSIDWNKIVTKTFITNRTFWFLPTLYVLVISYVVYYRFGQMIRNGHNWNKNDDRIGTCIDFACCAGVAGILVILMFLTRYQLFRDAVGYTIPFFAAVMYMEHGWIYRLFHKRLTAIAAAAVFIILIGGFDFDRISVATSLLRMLLGMCAVIILIQIFTRVHLPEMILGQLMIWGRSSLLIYILHGQFLGKSGLIRIESADRAVNLLWYCFISILACYVCSFLAWILGHVPILRVIFLGKIGGGHAEKR